MKFMNFKTPRAPPEGKASAFARLISGLSTTLAKITHALADLAQKVRPSTDQVTPIELYHCAWETASKLAYTIPNLKEWKSWENKFDQQIKSDEDALKFANEMLATLGDRYAILLSPAQVKAEQDRASGQ